MKGKNIITAILLAFVVVSVAVLILRESRGPAESGVATQSLAVTETATAAVNADNNSMLPPVSAQTAKRPAETDSNPVKVERENPVTLSGSTTNVTISPKVVVYYFHGNTRCITCRKIENFAKSAIESGFAAELKTGQIEFRTVNVEEPKNEHFVQDYQLATRSVVLSRLRNDKQDAWKNLDQVWTLVRDPEAFQRYVTDETKRLLGGA